MTRGASECSLLKSPSIFTFLKTRYIIDYWSAYTHATPCWHLPLLCFLDILRSRRVSGRGSPRNLPYHSLWQSWQLQHRPFSCQGLRTAQTDRLSGSNPRQWRSVGLSEFFWWINALFVLGSVFLLWLFRQSCFFFPPSHCPYFGAQWIMLWIGLK